MFLNIKKIQLNYNSSLSTESLSQFTLFELNEFFLLTPPFVVEDELDSSLPVTDSRFGFFLAFGSIEL
jgi:hypothetical protein